MNQVKQEIASIAARLIIEDGSSYYDAKSKAQELVLNQSSLKTSKKNIPNNIELEAAIKKYSMLFYKKEYIQRLTELRKKAKVLMKLLEIFRPILVGSVANETVTKYSDIRICCFAESTKEIAIELLNKGINSDSDFLRHPNGKDLVEALTFIWKEELTIIFALVHSESKAKLRGINLKDLGKLIM